MLCANQRLPSQLLQHFRHERRGNAVFLGDFIRAASMILVAVQRQMLNRNESVIGFFRKLKHLQRPRALATSPQGHMRLIQSGLSLSEFEVLVNLRFGLIVAITILFSMSYWPLNIAPYFLLHFGVGTNSRWRVLLCQFVRMLRHWQTGSDRDEFSQARSASEIVLARMDASANGGDPFFR